jgi:hypothetical protein
MAQYLTSDRVWELLTWYTDVLVTEQCRSSYTTCLTALQQYEQLLGYRSDEYDIAVRCAAVLMMCLTTLQQAESVRPMMASLDGRAADTLAKWSPLCGRREARIYSLPTGCLYGTTWRGKNRWSQHNRAQLHHVETYLIGCPFWDEAIADYGVSANGQIQWRSEDAMEAFYERYFPDDIPDEWTKEEKRKSHGDGILGPEERVSLQKYASRFLTLPSRLTWGCIGLVHTRLYNWAETECHPSSVIHAYLTQNRGISLNDEWLTPVHKIRRIE